MARPAVELGGIVPPLVTPFDRDEQVDGDAVRREVLYHLERGVDGICVCGSTGDGQMLAPEEAAAVVVAAVDAAGGRVPVVAGIIRDSTAEVVRAGLLLREAGADALQVTPVHYLFQPDEERTLEFYRRISEETGMPVVIYNVVPWALVPARTVARILDEVPGVVAVKQSGGNLHEVADLLHAAPTGGRVLTAVDDLLYPAYVLGAAGAISATLTVVPELCVAQWEAVGRGDHATALDIHRRLLPIWHAIDGPNMTLRIKAALRMQGRHGGYGRSPLTPVSESEARALRSALLGAGVELAA